MAIKYETTVIIRIIGILLSVFSLSILFIRPFDFVTNAVLVYGLLIAAAIVMIIGQVILLNIPKNEETKTKHLKHEVIYDIVTTSLVVILFTIFYAVPFYFNYVA